MKAVHGGGAASRHAAHSETRVKILNLFKHYSYSLNVLIVVLIYPINVIRLLGFDTVNFPIISIIPFYSITQVYYISRRPRVIAAFSS